MTFQVSTAFVDGNSESGNFLRLMLQGSTASSQGVVSHLDCQVSPTSPGASANLTISSGAVVVFGSEASFQGSYYGYNVGSDTSLTVAATGGASRSDMVVARAEDPTWSGSPWGNPASGQIIFPRILSGVAAGSTTPPGGSGSCIPLARIDMPASTSVVQASYIHDLRSVANPQRIMQAVGASGPGSPVSWTVSTTAHAWPPGASWQVFVPAWATTAVMSWSMSNIHFIAGGNNNARGFLYPVFGSSVSAPNLAFPQTLCSVSTSTHPQPAYHSTSGYAQAAIGPSLRNTTQTLQFAQVTDGTNTGLNEWTEDGQVTVLIEFQQLAAAT